MELKKYIDNLIQKYREFTGVENFPDHPVIEDFMPTDGGSDGVYAKETVQYINNRINCHFLLVTPIVLKEKADYIIFHELTHILDEEGFEETSTDGLDFLGYSGFHAAQVDLLKLVDAKSIANPGDFSMETPITVIKNGACLNCSVESYVSNSYNDAKIYFKKLGELLKKEEKDQGSVDLKMVTNLLEPLFNFWGRQSVCQEYAKDYDLKYKSIFDNLPMQPFEEFPFQKECTPIQEWEKLLHFHMDKEEKEEVNRIYKDTLDFITKNFLSNDES